MSFKKYRDIILGTVMLLFSGFYLIVARGIKTRPKLTPSYASAQVIPTLLGVLLAILAVLCIIEGVHKMKKYDPNAASGKEEAKGDPFAVIATFALMIVYALALPTAGFCLSTAVYLFLQISLLAPKDKRNLKLFAIIAVVFTMFVFVAFRIGLQMLLPRGVIEALLGF